MVVGLVEEQVVDAGLAVDGLAALAGGGAGVAPPGVRLSIGAGARYGACVAQAASVPRIDAWATTAKRDLMGWMVFEAMLALAAVLAIVWWTFRGRSDDAEDDETQ